MHIGKKEEMRIDKIAKMGKDISSENMREKKERKKPEKPKEKSRFVKDLIEAVFLALFIISFMVVFVLFFKPLFYLDIKLFHLEDAAGINADQIRKNYSVLISYFAFWNRGKLLLPDFRMSESGRIHFEDCKKIFDQVQYLFIGSGVLLAVFFMIRKKRTKDDIEDRSGQAKLFSSGMLLISGFLLTGIPALIGLMALIDWERLFVSFHRLFFSNDYWLFDPATDPVILILPDGFFFQCLAVILVLVIGSGLICIARAIKIRKADKYG